jgi:2-polyprenyl-3-methyl-5-hydroxy-6-metoxy-1,4-benzoquinol methylase
MRDFAFYRRITAPSHLQQIYNRAAAGWERGINALGYPEAYRDLCQQALQQQPARHPERVLDAGCGSGAMAAALLHHTPLEPTLHLLDLAPEMLQQAAASLPIATRLHQGAVGGDPLHDEPAFERILCAHVIEHCPTPLPPLRWLFDHLAPGGQLVLAVSRPHWCTALIRWRWGNAAYRPQTICRLLGEVGFTDITVHPHAKGPPARTSCGYLARRPG